MFCPKCSVELPSMATLRYCPGCGERLNVVGEVPADPMIGTVLSGRYRVDRLIGEGAMGRVYTAQQTIGSSARHVAVKMMLPQFTHDQELVARFNREAELAASLKHPSTVSVYELGRVEDGSLFVVMELVEGLSLSAELARLGTLPMQRVDAILRQICGSVTEAHSKHIVHRDLKPDNIMLSKLGDEDHVKVLDFGIAKVDDAQAGKLTAIGRVLGTPAYRSPEQFGGEPVDGRSDIYSLGIIAYQLLTGELPFEADGLGKWALQHMQGVPKPFAQTRFGAGVPPAVQQAIFRALNKNREDRPATAIAFYREFSAGSEGGSTAPWSVAPQRPQAGSGTIVGTPASFGITTGFTPDPAARAVGPPAGFAPDPAARVVARPAGRRPLVFGGLAVAVLGLAVVALLVSGGTSDDTAPSASAPGNTLPSAPQPAALEPPSSVSSAPESQLDPSVTANTPDGQPNPDDGCAQVLDALTCGEVRARLAQCQPQAPGYDMAKRHERARCGIDESGCKAAINASSCNDAKSAARRCPNEAKLHQAAHRRIAQLCGGGHRHGSGPARPAVPRPEPAHGHDD